MIKKKIMAWACALAGCVVMSGVPVSADTVSYSWRFDNTTSTQKAASGYKDDTEQNYYLTISSGNVSTVHVFGTRIRRYSDDAMMSSYVLHRGTKQSVPYPYSATANIATRYYLKGQKDSASTSGTALYAAGKVTY